MERRRAASPETLAKNTSNLVAQLQSGEIDMNFPGIGMISAQDFHLIFTVARYNIVGD
ncbi:hypothetical protein ABEW34_30360 [Paenibacillus algorifonticola]|uniref:hypothetical protein n=1 Tax=Paenibacillus algorifonticola TaxID=684063 RepID=UPI003D28B7E6